MPTYDYKCDACGHTFEEYQSFKDAELTKCPACKKNKLQKLLTVASGIIFKGAGFYETDYRSSSYTEAAKKDAEAAKPADTKPCGTCGDPAGPGACATNVGKGEKKK